MMAKLVRPWPSKPETRHAPRARGSDKDSASKFHQGHRQKPQPKPGYMAATLPYAHHRFDAWQTEGVHICRVSGLKTQWCRLGHVPLLWTDLSYQHIKLVGKRDAVAALHHKLAFANHVHESTGRAEKPMECAGCSRSWTRLFHNQIKRFPLRL